MHTMAFRRANCRKSKTAKMQLIFLGTGPAEAVPRNGHTDALCADARKAGSKSRRGRSSALLQAEGKNILIDASPDFLAQAGREKITKIDAVLLTHAHSDATGGISNLGKWLASLKLGSMPLYGHPETLNWIKKRIPKNLMPKPVLSYAKEKIENIPVLFLPVSHGVKPLATYGFLFENKFFYASDMEAMEEKGCALIKGVPTAIIDGTFWDKQILRGHMSAAQSLEFGKKINPQKLFLTQSGHTFPPFREAEREIKKIAKKQFIKFSVALAYDGLKIKI